MPLIILCIHCGNKTTGKYCAQCKTAEMRKSMDEENKKIMPNFVCKPCDLNWDSCFYPKTSPQAEKLSNKNE
ncbi:MAG: putative tRNA pseudouridine synthase B [Siphoviridae sp. cttb18]|nr:MAG: putative tRNA pseudouridine synthase B [Siphoviridae sp. cttb18]